MVKDPAFLKQWLVAMAKCGRYLSCNIYSVLIDIFFYNFS